MFKKLHHLGWSARCVRAGVAYLLVLQLLLPWNLRANPAGGNVVAGQANMQGGAGTLTVNQLSQRAIINWQDFSIAQGELTKFVQPNAASAVLNRVIGSNLSSIYGTLQANGQVYLINPNGIVIGPTGVVNTAGFVASTLDVDNSQFLAGGDLTFKGNSTAKVINMGKIGASEHDVILIAQQVENSGEIKALNGKAALAAGNEVLVKASGQERIFVQAGKGRVSNSGLIEAATAELKAAGGNEYALAINNTGTVRALGAVHEGGRILLKATSGKVKNSGTLAAKNRESGKTEVKVLGEKVELAASSKVEALGGGFVELSGYGLLTYGGTVNTEGGQVLIDPAVLTIAASGGDMTAADVVNLLKTSNVTLQADNIININQLIDASANSSSFDLALDTVALNLNQGITLKTGATLSGTATTVNIGAAGFVQNGIEAVAAGGVVNLAAATYLLSNEITIDKNLDLKGVVGSTILNAQNNSRVMSISNGTVLLEGLTLTGGRITTGDGGGLHVGQNAVVTLNRSTVSGNTNVADASAFEARGGGIFNEGTLILNQSLVTNNQMIGGGSLSLIRGGGIFSSNTLTLNKSTVSNNVVGDGVYISEGGGIYGFYQLTVNQSTIDGNRVGGSFTNSAYGGGIIIAGGGTLNLNQSTISNNAAHAVTAMGGGLMSVGSTTVNSSTIAGNTVNGNDVYGAGVGGFNFYSMTINQSTISGNVASGFISSRGGGIYNAGYLTIGGTIVAGNTATTDADFSLSGTNLISNGYNLSSHDFAGTGDLVYLGPINSLLGPLANNGGPTKTMALIVGSAAYLKGGTNPGGQLDQRGEVRGTTMSVGAWDYDPANLAPVVTTVADTFGAVIGSPALSLREAMWYVSTGAFGVAPTITFDESGVFATAQTININPSFGQFTIFGSQTIKGSAAGVTLDAQQTGRVMYIDGWGSVVTLDGLTLTGGTGYQGGGLYINGQGGVNVTVKNSTIANNTATGGTAGGGIFIWGANGNSTNVTIENSTIANNFSSNTGGGIYNAGVFGTAILTINNSTLTGNTGNWGGAIHNDAFTFAGSPSVATVTINGSTLSGNGANSGGGIYNVSGSIIVRGSILAGNTAGAAESDLVGGGLTSLGHNLYGQNGNAGGFTGNGTTDILLAGNINTVLAPLANNGGPTQTMALVTGSAAYLAGGVNSGGQLDQRGVARGSLISIGAWDLDPSAIAVAPVVTTNIDSANIIGSTVISLRDAIWYANQGYLGASPTITFDQAGVFSTARTITLTMGQLDLTASQSILGSAAGVTIDANSLSRVMQLTASVGGLDVNLRGLTLTRGSTSGTGGGVYIVGASGTTGNINLDRVQILGNSASSGGGIEVGGSGGILGTINLTIRNSTIAGNYAEGSGGALRVLAVGGGVTTTISNSTIGNNSAGANGGAIYNYAPNFGSPGFANLTILNSTIARNSTTGGSSNGGGIRNAPGGTVTIGSSIVSRNTHNGGGESDFVQSTGNPLVSLGYNLYGQYGDAGGFAGNGTTDILLADSTGLILAPLAYNGGPTQTMALIIPETNPAIAAGGPNTGFQLDQRGFARKATIDIGAYEFAAVNPFIVTATGDTTANASVGELRTAIAYANYYSGSSEYPIPTVTFDANGVFGVGQTITLDAVLGSLRITASQSIVGSAAGVTIDANVDGDHNSFTNSATSGNRSVLAINGSTAGVVVTLDGLTLTGGYSSYGGGIWIETNGSGNKSDVTIHNSTIRNNVATIYGGGIYQNGSGNNSGGGYARLKIHNSTLTGNRAAYGGAIASNWPFAIATVAVNNSTITGNVATASNGGGGIYTSSVQPGNGAVTLMGSIVAGNTNRDLSLDGALSSLGYNLYGTSNKSNWISSDIALGSTPIHAVLNPLADNGGPTQTMALIAGSVAYLKGGANSGGQLDQRGQARGATISIGAWDYDPTHLTPVVTTDSDALGYVIGGANVSLRDAIWYAGLGAYGANPEITFDEAGVFATAQTISLQNGQLNIGSSLKITGSTAGVTISGGGSSRVMQIRGSASGTTVDLTDLILSEGSRIGAVGDYSDENNYGGGLYVSSGAGELATVNLMAVTVRDSFARFGGGIAQNSYAGGRSVVILEAVGISGNSAVAGGGGMFVRSSGAGSSANATNLVGSYLNNTVYVGDGGAIALQADNGGLVLGTVAYVTLADNTASGFGGGVSLAANTGGGAGLLMANATIVNNEAGQSGGALSVRADASVPAQVQAQVRSTTISGNISGGAGGGIYDDSAGSGSIQVGETILSGNSRDDGINPVIESDYAQGVSSPVSALASLGWNIYGQNGSNGGWNPASSAGGADILLTKGLKTLLKTDANGRPLLANNGGFSQTVALVLGSVAIDAGDPLFGALYDQRGVGRGTFGSFTGTRGDIGAYEAQIIRVIANNQTVPFGTVPMPTYTVTNGNAAGLLSGSPAVLGFGGAAGNYVIGQGGLVTTNANYLLAFTDGILTVVPPDPVEESKTVNFGSFFADFSAGQANDENEAVDGVTGSGESGPVSFQFAGGGKKVPGAMVHVSSGDLE